MKAVVIAILLILVSNFSIAQDAAKNQVTGITIKVKIANVRTTEGHVLFSLHTEDTFMKGPGIKTLAVVAEDGVATAIFENVPSGNYAILALHDKNDNRRMDFEPNGMPKEDYGTSNNVMSMGPPQFTEAEFKVANEDLEITIRF